jgi:ABC-type transport system involved in multi-copper enzyme maturation permease subunit
MSMPPTVATPATPAGPEALAAPPHRRPWGLWGRQIAAVLRLEIVKSFLGKRAAGLYLLALLPVITLGARALAPGGLDDPQNVAGTTELYAGLYQSLLLRLVIFFACAEIFGNLIRRELLDRSLHYYFLSPVRREVLVAAKFLTGLLVAVFLFSLSTVVSFFLAYVPHESTAVQNFLFSGPGLGHLGAYLLVTFLACVGYGSVFLALGFFFKSPAIPALAVFGWEAILFLLPPLLKKVSVYHYLQSLCPIPISEGPLALLADAPSPWVAIPGLLILALALIALSAWKIRGMEISYDES